MSKNVIIGFVVVALLGLGGYYLAREEAVPDEQVVTNTGNTPAPTPSTPVVPMQPDSPTVETGINPIVSSSTAVVSGQVRPNGASTTYWFEYGETTALGDKTVFQNIGSGFSMIPTPAFITGLESDTVYYYRLSARNSFSTVNGTTYTFKTNDPPPPVRSLPTARTSSATNITRVSANMNGSINPNGAETNYWFEYGEDTDLGSVTGFQSTNSGTSSLSVTTAVSGLEPLTKYYFRLNAQNRFGTVNGAILNFTTLGPSAPASPSVSTTNASNITDSSARLRGNINPNGDETTYWFEYSEDSLLGSLLSTKTTNKTLQEGNSSESVQENLTQLDANTKYYYRLIGRNSYGTEEGDILSFTTKN